MSTGGFGRRALVLLLLSAGCSDADNETEMQQGPALPMNGVDATMALPDAGNSTAAIDAGSTTPAPRDSGTLTPSDAGSGNSMDASDSALASHDGGGNDAGGDGGANDGGPSGDAGPVASTGCMSNTLKPGNTTVMLMHANAQRNFLLHVPASYDGTKAVPLVIDHHGYTSDATAQAGVSGWRAKSDKEGFIVANPNGLDNSWNGGALCCGTSQSRRVDDEGFIRAVVKKISADGCIDAKRVYATGLSNGGAMSHLLACRAADVFAASAPVSMGNGTRPCMPTRPISITMFRGTSDALVPYNGGTFPSAKADFDQWKELNGCTGMPTKSGPCETYSGCKAGTEVTLCTIQNGSHVVYEQAAAAGANVPDTAWEMFKRQALP